MKEVSSKIEIHADVFLKFHQYLMGSNFLYDFPDKNINLGTLSHLHDEIYITQKNAIKSTTSETLTCIHLHE